MGVDYKSGPHYYKLKKVSKRAAESSTQDPTKQKAPHTADADPKEAVLPEDTLLSSSGDSSLPPGLFLTNSESLFFLTTSVQRSFLIFFI